MAIPYKSNPLPAVSAVAFDIFRWGGVNNTKGAQADYEMSSCKNMASDNYPYASPRKPREKIVDEQGIQRIYKVEGDRVYCIDSENYLCFWENGVKSFVTYTENETETKIQMGDCTCTNNYNKGSVFYPNVRYVDEKNKIFSVKYPIVFGDIIGPYKYENHNDETRYRMEMKATDMPIDNVNATSFMVSVKFPDEDEWEFPTNSYFEDWLQLPVVLYDKNGESKGSKWIKWYKDDPRNKSWTLSFTNLEEGDYIGIKLNLSEDDENNVEFTYQKRRYNFLKSGEWFIEASVENGATNGNPCIKPLDYGVVYNNRIVGVSKNDIRASALGDFTNFYEFVDEAGNPSATGAYATDVGSFGDFTGICAYNNVLQSSVKVYGIEPYIS